MDFKTLAKKMTPGAFRPFLGSVLRLADYPRLLFCIIAGRPYFGRVMAARQGSYYRYPVMSEFLRARIRQGSSMILEIGSWAGGSAIVFAKVCKEEGSGTVYCLDPWTDEINFSPEMRKAVKRDGIFRLFSHNIFWSGASDRIRVLRGKSEEILPLLKDNSFDVIYIDGSHRYSEVMKDFKNALPKLRQGGVICGDDLEMEYADVDQEYARYNKEIDFITDPRTGKNYHPGVTMAVHDTFGKVNVSQGFWFIDPSLATPN